jgi:hypothetical protein
MSEYALGDYGWLMTSAFFVLGLAPFVATIGLRESKELVEDDLGDHFSGIRFKPGRKQAGKLPFNSRVTLSTSRK